jgi:hypothetical protein
MMSPPVHCYFCISLQPWQRNIKSNTIPVSPVSHKILKIINKKQSDVRSDA